MLGKLPVPGHPTTLITVGQGPTALAVGAGGGCFGIFTLIYPFFPLSSSLWKTARYRLKYCLKGPLSPKPTNHPISLPGALGSVVLKADIFSPRQRILGTNGYTNAAMMMKSNRLHFSKKNARKWNFLKEKNH